MSWQIGSVTLPLSPGRITHPHSAIINKFKITGGTPLIQGLGFDAETLTVTVPLHSGNLTIDQLGSYLSALKAYVGSTVTITFPHSYHNGTWLMTNLEPEETTTEPDRINVTIKFVRGSAIEIL